MPGANYMGGRRNAAKARIKDTTGRLEKSFFGQRRLYALSKGLSASKSMQRFSQEESLGLADISLGHARQRIPPNNDVVTSSFVPSPIHISPCTPRSRRRTKRRLELQSSSSNISKSAVLDALDVSEPMFLRGVLDRILTMPDLAGISGNRTKPTVATGRQTRASDESSPLQQTKRKVQSNLGEMNSQRLIHFHRRKRSPSDLYEESGSPSNERPSPSLRHMQSYTYGSICTPPQKKYTSSDHKIVDKERTRTFKNLLVEDNIFPAWDNTSNYHRDDYNMELNGVDADDIHDSICSEIPDGVQGYVRSSPWSSRDYRSSLYSDSLKPSSSIYSPNSTPDFRKIMNWNESHTRLPTSIVFRGLEDGSAKRPIVTDTYPVEEPTVYGTLFEQADPWDAIGQILGLSITKPSKFFGELIDEYSEIDENETSLGTRSEVVEVLGQSPQLSYLRNDVGEIAQGSEDDQDCLSGVIEDKRLFSPKILPRDILEALKSPDRITRVELDSLEWSATKEAICSGESRSILSIPELEELDGLYMGPSLFDELDDEDEF